MGKKAKNGKSTQRIKPSRVFVYALAVAALGGGGYLVYDRVKRKRLSAQNILPDPVFDSVLLNNARGSTPVLGKNSQVSAGNEGFPLQRGSKGSRVKTLQRALSKTTPSILIDGQFGPQTSAALKAAGYPDTVDQSLFNKITGANPGALQVVFNPGILAVNLYKSTQARDLSGVLAALKQMTSVSDYSSVNEYYKKQSFISRTIVTDLLDYAFKANEAAKLQIKNEFKRIGLKVDDSGKWSLQGVRLYNDLITIRETLVTDARNNKIPVGRNTILGDELEISNGMTWFRSIDNSILKVPTQDVKYT